MNYNYLNKKEFYLKLFYFFLTTIIIMNPDILYAADDKDPFGGYACKMILLTNSWAVKGTCIVVIGFLGIKVMTGQVREMYTTVIVPVIGIVVVLSAPKVLTMVSNINEIKCTDGNPTGQAAPPPAGQ